MLIPVEEIISRSAIDDLLSRSAIVSTFAIEDIVSSFAIDGIVSISAIDILVAHVSVNPFVSLKATKNRNLTSRVSFSQFKFVVQLDLLQIAEIT